MNPTKRPVQRLTAAFLAGQTADTTAIAALRAFEAAFPAVLDSAWRAAFAMGQTSVASQVARKDGGR